MPTPDITNTTVHQTLEDWVHTNSATGEITIQTGTMNAVISPETGKYQGYRHLTKDSEKPKMDQGHGQLNWLTIPRYQIY